MGIVERAVELAQSDAKAAEAVQLRTPDEPALRTAAESRQRTALPERGSTPSLEAVSLPGSVEKRVVQLDPKRLRDLGRLPPENSSQQAKEEMRRIKWPLLAAITGCDGANQARNNVIQVTSALPGEGKTYAALMLALSIVLDRERRVVLVDGDVARPGLTPAVGLEDSRGLTDVLENLDLDIDSVTYETDVEGLFVIPAGKWHERSSELLASNRMPQVIEQLSRRLGGGVIIIDSPPLLATNEAQVITRHVGQVLLVVRANDTEQQAVLTALALVDKDARIRSVLNCVTPSVLNRYYGKDYYKHGAGYGYGQHYGRGSTADKGNP